MNTGRLFFISLLVVTLIGFAGCKDDDEHLDVEIPEAVPLLCSFSEDGILAIRDAHFLTKQQYETVVEGQAWKVVSSDIILPDGTLREASGNVSEWIYVFNHGRMAMLMEYTFNTIAPKVYYDNYGNYDETTGSNGDMWFVGLSDDGNEISIIHRLTYYPEQGLRPRNGYELKVLQKVSTQELGELYQKYGVDESQLIAVPKFDSSNGADLFGASIDEITFQYMQPQYDVAARGMKQISKSVFDKYISGYGWKCEEAHQIEPDGSINPEEFVSEYPFQITYHYYFGTDVYWAFFLSSSDKYSYYEHTYTYDETLNKIYGVNIDNSEFGPRILVSLSEDHKTLYLVQNNHGNMTSSLVNERYNLLRYVRMTEEELQNLTTSAQE